MPKWAENLPNTTWTSKLAKSFNNFARLEEFCQIWSHGWSVRNEIGLRYNCASSKNECTIETKSWMEAREREIKMMNWWSFLSINVHLFASKKSRAESATERNRATQINSAQSKTNHNTSQPPEPRNCIHQRTPRIPITNMTTQTRTTKCALHVFAQYLKLDMHVQNQRTSLYVAS